MTSDDARALLDSLRRALHRGTSFEWMAEHATDGDPVPAAWAACPDEGPMLALLRYAGDGELADELGAIFCCTACETSVDGCPRCVEDLRARVPALTLAEIVGGRRVAA